MDEVRSHVRLDLPHLTVRPTQRLFPSFSNPILEGPLRRVPKRSTSPQATSTLEWWDSLKALDPNRPIREADMPNSIFKKFVVRGMLVNCRSTTLIDWPSRTLNYRRRRTNSKGRLG